ncbi:MAG: hypothetical protein E7606_03610 [Ruminococcaceae bacterium]|nr:hypothetical protein [Oscillospiraceae bacterium]
MKKARRFLALLLALLMLLATLTACGGKARTLMKVDDREISVNLYQLMLSIRKGEMAFAIAQSYGNANSAAFWGTVIDDTSSTYDDYYTAEVFNKLKSYAAALALFDELELTLPASYVKAVDEEMATLVAEDGDGKKAKLNSILAEFGANYDILREYKLMVKEVEYLIHSLYGQNGSKISAPLKEDYLKENYVAFKQILLSNFYYLFETDKNGDEIYYQNDGSIAYDTENGIRKVEDGAFVYYTEDGRIAYDKEVGRRKPVLDAKGNQVSQEYTKEEMLDRLNLALKLRDVAENESAATFETLRQSYSDEEFGNDYDADALNYLSTATSYSSISADWKTLDAIAAKLAELEVGELAILQTDAGIHLIRKYPVEAGAYADERYTQWFTDSLYGVYDFHGNLIDSLLTARLAAYEAEITVDTSLLKGLSLKSSPSNFYYN